MNSHRHSSDVELSVISPARNEEENINNLIKDVGDALCPSGVHFELIVVDDGSTDRTLDIAINCMRLHRWLRILRIYRGPANQGCGKSAALLRGIEAASGDFVAFIDADGQNDARDLTGMLQLLKESQCDMVHGDRSGRRRDNWHRRFSSIAASRLRQFILRDGIRDSACGLQLMTREMASALPLQFTGIHRFLPCYGKIAGYNVLQMPVAHKPRIAGRSKYGFGNRVFCSLTDMLALFWMSRRFRMGRFEELRLVPRANSPEGTAAVAEAVAAHLPDSK
jgi:glycosyltransferase involved in cell wall biosynthesis